MTHRHARPVPTPDPIVAMHRAALDKLANMTSAEVMDVAVRAGIYTKDYKLTPPYRTPSPRRRSR